VTIAASGSSSPLGIVRVGVGAVGVPSRAMDVENAVALDHPSLYAARFIHILAGDWSVLGFRDAEDGAFIGEVMDSAADRRRRTYRSPGPRSRHPNRERRAARLP